MFDSSIVLRIVIFSNNLTENLRTTPYKACPSEIKRLSFIFNLLLLFRQTFCDLSCISSCCSSYHPLRLYSDWVGKDFSVNWNVGVFRNGLCRTVVYTGFDKRDSTGLVVFNQGLIWSESFFFSVDFPNTAEVAHCGCQMFGSTFAGFSHFLFFRNVELSTTIQALSFPSA